MCVDSFKGLDAHSIEHAKEAQAKYVKSKKENKLEIFEVKPDSKRTFRQLTDGWYLQLEERKSLKSYREMTNHLSKFNEEFGEKIVGKIKLTDLEEYQAKRKKAGIADATVDQELSLVKTMITKAF